MYPLASDPTKNLYQHIRDLVQNYYDKSPKQGLRKSVNFEEMRAASITDTTLWVYS
jgi:hypothetical protein